MRSEIADKGSTSKDMQKILRPNRIMQKEEKMFNSM